MTPLAPPPLSCCAYPRRGLLTRKADAHSMTRLHYPRIVLITYPALHSRAPSTFIGLRRPVRSQQSATKTIGRVPKSP
jgi:hypothetical protein